MSNFERTTPEVSIVIPSWFEPRMHGRYGDNEVYACALKCIQRLISTIDRDKVEIILIDNGSTLRYDDVQEQGLADPGWYWDQADVLIKNPTNQGFGIAMNQGLNIARGKYIIAMNNDILVVGEHWLDKLLCIFEDKNIDPPVGLCMPNLIKKEYQKDCIDSNSKRLDFNKVFELKEENLVLRNEGIWEKGAEFGSCFAMKKELFDKIREVNGGYEFYDEKFRVGYCEDRALYIQVRELGFQTYRNNWLRVGHVGGLSMSKIKGREGVREIIDENRRYLAKLKKEKGLI